MGKIIGESFDPYVAKQIEVRQRKLGATTRDSDLLAYTTSKTSWLRLTSGVNVDENKLSELGRNQDLAGNLLAESYVLFGGANNVTNSPMPKGGFPNSYPNSLSQNASYGFNSKKEYGLTPLPGIESAEIVPKNRGSLREANIVIKAFNREQFNIIETLYMRLKYSILLEWGHTMYFDNKGTLRTRPINDVYKQFLSTEPIVIPDNKFETTSTSRTGLLSPDPIRPDVTANQNKILELIKNQRRNSNGNYDGFLGWVTNFSWELSPHGVYTISLKAISYGDVIESLSITKPLPLSPVKGEKDEPKGSPIELVLNRFKDLLSRSSYVPLNDSLVKDFQPTTIFNSFARLFGASSPNPGTYVNGENLTEGNIKKLMNAKSNFYTPPQNYLAEKELIQFQTRWIAFRGEDENAFQSYIKLGSLLRLIQNFFLIYNPSQSDSPLTSIDYDYDNTFCSIPFNILSADPSICLIPSNIELKKENFTNSTLLQVTSRASEQVIDLPEIFNQRELNDLLGYGFLQGNTMYTAKPLHIHINIDFIISQLKNNLDENGDLSLYDFLSSILRGINSALAGTTDLGVYYDEETNTYSIIDNNPPPTLPSGDTDLPTKLNIKGIQNNFGSFVKSFAIKSEISNKFATQIAIGAQANNTSLGSNSVAFSDWNFGLEDRIISKKTYSTDPNNIISQSPSVSEEDLIYVLKYLRLLGTGLDLTRLDQYKSHIVNYLKIERDIEVQNGNLLSKSFIPISLNLELDGLSGIKLFQKYSINDEILPRNYRDNIEFLTKGLRHSIDQSGWTTSIEGLSIPKQK